MGVRMIATCDGCGRETATKATSGNRYLSEGNSRYLPEGWRAGSSFQSPYSKEGQPRVDEEWFVCSEACFIAIVRKNIDAIAATASKKPVP